MTTRVTLIVGAILLLAAFLLGLVPQYRTASGLRRDLRAAREETTALRSKLELAELRDLIGLAYLESSAKNYGIARQHSSRFFTRAAEIVNGAADESLKTLLTEALAQRDHVTAGLAEGQGAVQMEIEKLTRRIHEGTVK